jgi:hypothetical protein
MGEDGAEQVTAELRGMLTDKGVDVERAAHLALTDGQTLQVVLDGVLVKEDAYRYNCVKVLLQIGDERPRILYPEWDYFAGLLDSDNSYHRSTAVLVLARLARVDAEGRFERILDRYLALLDDEKIVTARYLAQHAGRVAQVKPHLRARITERLLGVDGTHHAQGRKDLLKADVIQAFEAYFDQAEDQDSILAFVEAQLDCSSPKTRKAAKAFLKRYNLTMIPT